MSNKVFIAKVKSYFEHALYIPLIPLNEEQHNQIMRPQKIVEESKYNVA